MNIESLLPAAEYHYTINEADVTTDKYNTDGQVQQNGKLDISVYATADGYKATATVGSAKAQQGVLHFTKPNESIVIAKIKGNDLKMLSSDICVWKSQFATSKLLQGHNLRL